MSESLPLRANLEWLKKTCKDLLELGRADNPLLTLSEVQWNLAVRYGFASWQKLKSHVETVQEKLGQLIPNNLDPVAIHGPVAPDDPQLAELFGAIEKGDQPALVGLLRVRPALAKAKNESGMTPLHAAAECNDPNLALALLAFGADLEARYGNSGHTPLSWAVTCNAIEFARALLKVGAKADLFCAAGIGALDQVEDCFGADGELLPGSSRTGSTRYSPQGVRLPCPPETAVEVVSDALYIASRNGQAAVVSYLLEKKPDLDFRGYLGATALHWAYFSRNDEVVQRLESAGAEPQALDHTFGVSPLAFGICVPAQWGFTWLVEKQLEKNPDLAQCVDHGTSPLHEAARAGHATIVRILLSKGAEARVRDRHGKRAIDLAQEKGHFPVVACLEGLS